MIKRNKLWLGSPGTGKSYNAEKEVRNLLEWDAYKEPDGEQWVRTAFHREVTYSSFIGGVEPKTEYTHSHKPYSYLAFTPKLFLKVLKNALENPEIKYALLIEEINRANVTHVFGDFMVLLERDEYGKSKYELTNHSEDIEKFLGTKTVILPNNFYLFATANKLDRSVYNMDAAFLRRWSTTFMPVFGVTCKYDEKYVYGNYTWKEVRNDLNKKLEELGFEEDRCVGAYFLEEGEMNKEDFKNKLITYVWDNMAPEERYEVFHTKSISEVYSRVDKEKSIYEEL